MHFYCKCGNRISDTRDNLPYSARVGADVDLYDYWEAWERRGRGQALGSLMDPMDYEKVIFQCDKCGRIYFDDPDDPRCFISFTPEDKNVMVTGPIEGVAWKGYIYGISDLGLPKSIGSCYTIWNNGSHEECQEFTNYKAMREYFDSKVTELKGKGLLRHAWVNKDGETIFRWDIEDREPVQAKMELYLTEQERAALERFKADHAECQYKYPKGNKGWNFSYEILPGICGANDRDIKATCLRCGAFIESKDGAIVEFSTMNSKSYNPTDPMFKVLNMIHERGNQEVRSETISMPQRYYDIATAIGYVRGLIDMTLQIDDESVLPQVFQHCIKRLTDKNVGTPELRHLIRNSCYDGEINWVLEEGLKTLKTTLKDDFPDINIPWVKEHARQRD